MNETQVLLGKIAALRKRLEQNPILARASERRGDTVSWKREDAEGTRSSAGPSGHRVTPLEHRVAAGSRQNVLLNETLRQLAGTSNGAGEDVARPGQLTARARRLLEQGRDLLGRLQTLAGEPLLQNDEADPLTLRYRQTVAMADTALRTVQAYPDAPSLQLHLCAGLEAILQVVAERLTALTAALDQRRQENAEIETLADHLASLGAGQALDIKSLATLAEKLLTEAQQAAPLHFLYQSPEQPARFVACHSLTVARVVARLVKHDPELRGRPLEPVLAALVHDVGMLRVPVQILTQPGPLNDEQRRAVEAHTRTGAEITACLLSMGAWLAEAVASHHERLDGTGYPAGLRELQVTPLIRLLAVCDVYAAWCAPRPHRPALDPRTALTDTLLLAEKGALDRYHAERLLQLSFYPVGSVVELADGAVGVVVATHPGRRDLNAPARPVLALLTDPDGQPVPLPCHIDLAMGEGRTIVRTLQPAERRQLLGARYLELA